MILQAHWMKLHGSYGMDLGKGAVFIGSDNMNAQNQGLKRRIYD